MSEFYSSPSLKEVVPKCDLCYSQAVMKLVDFIFKDDKITPVWHCSDCKQLKADRTSELENILTSRYYDCLRSDGLAISNNLNYSDHNVQSNLVNVIKSAINNYNDQGLLSVLENRLTEQMRCKVQILSEDQVAINDRLSKLETSSTSKDELSELRQRVAGFTLN